MRPILAVIMGLINEFTLVYGDVQFTTNSSFPDSDTHPKVDTPVPIFVEYSEYLVYKHLDMLNKLYIENKLIKGSALMKERVRQI